VHAQNVDEGFVEVLCPGIDIRKVGGDIRFKVGAGWPRISEVALGAGVIWRSVFQNGCATLVPFIISPDDQLNTLFP
jgi:hypothetical protein